MSLKDSLKSLRDGLLFLILKSFQTYGKDAKIVQRISILSWIQPSQLLTFCHIWVSLCIFFLNHLKISCRHNASFTSKYLAIFNKAIFLKPQYKYQSQKINTETIYRPFSSRNATVKYVPIAFYFCTVSDQRIIWIKGQQTVTCGLLFKEVLLENSHAHLLSIVSSCFRVKTEELSSCEYDYLTYKAWSICCLAFYRKSMPNHDFNNGCAWIYS